MSDVSTWSFTAFFDDDPEGVHDENRILAAWQIVDTVRWAEARGYDNIYVARLDDKTRFRRRPPTPGIRVGEPSPHREEE